MEITVSYDALVFFAHIIIVVVLLALLAGAFKQSRAAIALLAAAAGASIGAMAASTCLQAAPTAAPQESATATYRGAVDVDSDYDSDASDDRPSGLPSLIARGVNTMDDNLSADDGNVKQRFGRNDPRRTGNTRDRFDLLAPFIAEEHEREEAKPWWGNAEY